MQFHCQSCFFWTCHVTVPGNRVNSVILTYIPSFLVSVWHSYIKSLTEAAYVNCLIPLFVTSMEGVVQSGKPGCGMNPHISHYKIVNCSFREPAWTWHLWKWTAGCSGLPWLWLCWVESLQCRSTWNANARRHLRPSTDWRLPASGLRLPSPNTTLCTGRLLSGPPSLVSGLLLYVRRG